MADTDITTLVDALATVVLDSTVTASIQDDLFFELARGAYPDVLVQVGAEFIAVTAEEDTYSFEPDTAQETTTPLLIFFDDWQLAQATKQEAWAMNSDWRQRPTPRPVAFTMDPENRTSIALVPPPQYDGEAFTIETPLDAWRERNITVISARTEFDVGNNQLTFDGPTYEDVKFALAWETLARELARDSNHQDKTAAEVAHGMANFFFQMSFPEAVLSGVLTGTR